jgi:hypothetical protein
MSSEQRQALAQSLIQPSQLTFDNVRLRRSAVGSLWEVVGTVKNNSNSTLSEFTLLVTVQDCPEGASCVTIGQDDVWVYSLNVPPGQLRTFDGLASLDNMPKPQKLIWNYKLVSVKADVE